MKRYLESIVRHRAFVAPNRDVPFRLLGKRVAHVVGHQHLQEQERQHVHEGKITQEVVVTVRLEQRPVTNRRHGRGRDEKGLPRRKVKVPAEDEVAQDERQEAPCPAQAQAQQPVVTCKQLLEEAARREIRVGGAPAAAAAAVSNAAAAAPEEQRGFPVPVVHRRWPDFEDMC
jgi:hypothetical protein